MKAVVKNNRIKKSFKGIVNTQNLQKGNLGYKKVRTCELFKVPYNENHRAAKTSSEESKSHEGGNSHGISEHCEME